MGLVVMPVNLVLVLLLLAVSVQCLAQVTVPDTLPNGSLRRVWSFSIGVIAQPTRSSMKKTIPHIISLRTRRWPCS